MKASALIPFGLALIGMVACTDVTEPPLEEGDDNQTTSDVYNSPEFTVTTDPSPLPAGEAADITVQWTDTDLDVTSAFIVMEGARSVGCGTLQDDPRTGRYTYVQRLAMPDAFLSNLLFIDIRDDDGNLMHVLKAEVEGDFEEPENTPPTDLLTILYPPRITPGQSIQISLQGHDEENNMVPGLTAKIAGDPDAGFAYANQTYAVNADAGVFSYRLGMVAPTAEGEYELLLTVADLDGDHYTVSETFVVEPTNTPPHFTEIWIEDKDAEGYMDSVPFRVSGFDPDGDLLRLMVSVGNGSSRTDPPMIADDGTMTWTGAYVAQTNVSQGNIRFRLYDGNVEVPSQWYSIRVDQSGKPILDRYRITRGGVTTTHPLKTNTYLTVARGETVKFELDAHDPQGSPLDYEWYRYFNGVSEIQGTGRTFEYQMPDFEGVVHISCTVRDPEGNLDSVSPTIFTVR